MMSEEGLREDGVHVFSLRFDFEDTDVGGVVYYANYLKFTERGQTEILCSVGLDHQRMMRNYGLASAVTRCEVDYLLSARLDDRLEVLTGNLKIQAASLWVDQAIKRGGDNVASLRVRPVCLAANGWPARLPGTLRTALGPLSESQNQHRFKER